MSKIYFITRSDDAGSSNSANAAIAHAVKVGFIRNVSIMAPGAYTEQAAGLLAHNKNVCFGMHGTLNAEWDKVKWRPVSSIGKESGLVDTDGYFWDHPEKFTQTKPPVELIMKEYVAQLDKLTRLGFRISYIDSHMFPELYIPGMDEAVADFAKTKGLLDHMYYYKLPTKLFGLPRGQYFYLTHPAVYSAEMLQTGNSECSGADIAKARAKEAKLLSSRSFKLMTELLGIRPLRYDEAIPFKERLTVDDAQQIIRGGQI